MERLKNSRVFLGKNSKEVQEKVFKLGFKYSSGSTEFNFKDPFLFFDGYGEIYSSGDLEFFNTHEYEEVTSEYILSLEVKKKPEWVDFGEVSGFFVDEYAKVDYQQDGSSYEENANTFPTKEEAEACLALSQLCQWRNRYNQGWKPDWKNDNEQKYVIKYYDEKIDLAWSLKMRNILAFKSAEIRDKFLEDFRELIEQAKPLL